MDKTLWNNVLAFELDQPGGNGFSARVALKNYWTKSFTQKAILEYRKFMYLAAITDAMVSPSPVVDEVWHEHLVFTQSYADFCAVLGKRIEHVPSTHQRDQLERFRAAKDRTRKLYRDHFGEAPRDVWEYPGMFESLRLPKAAIKIRTFLVIGIIAVIVIAPFAFLFLRSFIQSIQNPDFLWILVGIFLVVIGGLYTLNRFALDQMIRRFDRESFIFQLTPFELTYLKWGEFSYVIDAYVNDAIRSGKIRVNDDKTLTAVNGKSASSLEEEAILHELGAAGAMRYSALQARILRMPAFSGIRESMDALSKYIAKSRDFGRLFYINFILLSTVWLFSFLRLVTGIVRDKPVMEIAIAVIVIAIVIYRALSALVKMPLKSAICNYYKEKLIPYSKGDLQGQWAFFLMGAAVLAPSFASMSTLSERANSGSWGFDSSSSCSSGDGGSSCGSSCGGCGD